MARILDMIPAATKLVLIPDPRPDATSRGVRRYRVLRPVDDPNYVMVNLEFDIPSEAEAFRAALQRAVWGSRRAAPALLGSPQAHSVEAVKIKEY